MAEQLPLALPVRPALRREDFLVSPANSEAVAMIDAWPAWPVPRLAVVGPEAAGKSHLAAVWAARSGARTVAWRELLALGPQALAAGPLVLEDAAALAGDDAGERALFHLINLLGERGHALLLTARMPPARWPVGLADLASRLAACPVVRIGAPDDALLAAVLVKHFTDRQIQVPPTVVRYLLARIERSFAAVHRVAEALDRAALAEGRPVTRDLARRVLDKLAAAGA